MPRILIVDNKVRLRTRSTDFVFDLFAGDEVTVVYDATWKSVIEQTNPDLIVIWQGLPDLKDIPLLRRHNVVLIPMYDQCRETPGHIWAEFFGFKFVCFSRELHKRLSGYGLWSHSCTFFPEPSLSRKKNSELSCLFWQRQTKPDLETLAMVLSDVPKLKLYFRSDLSSESIPGPSTHIDHIDIEQFSWEAGRETYLDLVRKCDLYFASRYYEGIGLSFLEAMASGACVIAANRPTMNEYIIDGVNGYLYDPDDPRPINLARIAAIQANLENYVVESRRRYEDSVPMLKTFMFASSSWRKVSLRALFWSMLYSPIIAARRLAWAVRKLS